MRANGCLLREKNCVQIRGACCVLTLPCDDGSQATLSARVSAGATEGSGASTISTVAALQPEAAGTLYWGSSPLAWVLSYRKPRTTSCYMLLVFASRLFCIQQYFSSSVVLQPNWSRLPCYFAPLSRMWLSLHLCITYASTQR